MISDLSFIVSNSGHKLRLIGESELPERLKRAITLMLFSQDPNIRNFNNSSIATAFPTLTEASLPGIQANLTLAATRRRQILQQLYSDITGVYFETQSEAGKITVTLNVDTRTTTETTVIYNE